MTTVEYKVKTYAKEHKEELLVAGAVVTYIGAMVLYANGYKKGFETGRETGKMEFLNYMLDVCNKSKRV